MKAKACAEVDIKFTHIQLNASASADEVIAEVRKLNVDESVSGILVQLPMGEHVNAEDERSVTEAVDPKKDVDGCVPALNIPLICVVRKTEACHYHRFHAYNIGHLQSKASEPLFKPCTPAGIIQLLESTGVEIGGSKAVVLGRSDIVGSPVVAMLRKLDATVTQCHSRTKDLPFIVSPRSQFLDRSAHTFSVYQLQHADIVVSAIGKADFVKGEWIKPGAVVIDVGTNYVPGMYPLPKYMDRAQSLSRCH